MLIIKAVIYVLYEANLLKKIINESRGNSLMIFTDGAVCGGSVGLVCVQLFSFHLQKWRKFR